MDKMKKLKRGKNKLFKCMACNEQSLRGALIEVRKGSSKGIFVKTCTKPECIIKASWGEI